MEALVTSFAFFVGNVLPKSDVEELATESRNTGKAERTDKATEGKSTQWNNTNGYRYGETTRQPDGQTQTDMHTRIQTNGRAYRKVADKQRMIHAYLHTQTNIYIHNILDKARSQDFILTEAKWTRNNSA